VASVRSCFQYYFPTKADLLAGGLARLHALLPTDETSTDLYRLHADLTATSLLALGTGLSAYLVSGYLTPAGAARALDEQLDRVLS
jgi:hypothetical protein